MYWRGAINTQNVTLDSIPFVCVPLKQLLIDRHSTEVRVGKVSHLDGLLSASIGTMDNRTHQKKQMPLYTELELRLQT